MPQDINKKKYFVFKITGIREVVDYDCSYTCDNNEVITSMSMLEHIVELTDAEVRAIRSKHHNYGFFEIVTKEDIKTTIDNMVKTAKQEAARKEKQKVEAAAKRAAAAQKRKKKQEEEEKQLLEELKKKHESSNK